MEYDISSVFVLVLLQTQVIIIVHYTYLYSNKHLSHDTLLRSFRLHIANIYITSLRQYLTSQNRYCQEAVNSVESVTSCPTSKKEWDIAALRKNCSGIASRQNCTKKVEKFQYHCVINGLRNKLVEVCASTRIIFGIFYFLQDFVNFYFFQLYVLFQSVNFYDFQDIVLNSMFVVELFKIRDQLPATKHFQSVTTFIHLQMLTNVRFQKLATFC